MKPFVFHLVLRPIGKAWIHLENNRAGCSLALVTSLREGKFWIQISYILLKIDFLLVTEGFGKYILFLYQGWIFAPLTNVYITQHIHMNFTLLLHGWILDFWTHYFRTEVIENLRKVWLNYRNYLCITGSLNLGQRNSEKKTKKNKQFSCIMHT